VKVYILASGADRNQCSARVAVYSAWAEGLSG